MILKYYFHNRESKKKKITGINIRGGTTANVEHDGSVVK